MEKIANHFLPNRSKKLPSSKTNVIEDQNRSIVFVLPLAGRLKQFERFLDIFKRVAVEQDNNSQLLVVLFGGANDTAEHLKLINDLKEHHPNTTINCIQYDGAFSRGLALDKASRSSYIENNNIILFIDVDMSFTLETLQRIRLNTVCGKQVYLPIVFSQYDINRTSSFNSDEKGYFRQYGFGICAICKSDILDDEINGFDKNIIGWGLEDVLLLDRIVKVGQRQNPFLSNTAKTTSAEDANASNLRKLSIFRAPDPSLIHIYHEINCDIKLESHQYQMCLGTKANSLGSTKFIESLLYSKTDIIDFIEKINSRSTNLVQNR